MITFHFKGNAYHVRSDSEHQRKRRAEGLQSADDRGAPRLVHLSASWDLADRKLGNKRAYMCVFFNKCRFSSDLKLNEICMK